MPFLLPNQQRQSTEGNGPITLKCISITLVKRNTTNGKLLDTFFESN